MGRRLRLRNRYLRRDRACISTGRLRVFNRRSGRRSRQSLCRRRRRDGVRRQKLRETQGLRMGHLRRDELRRRRLQRRSRLTGEIRRLLRGTRMGRRRLEEIRRREPRELGTTRRLRTETPMGLGRLVRSRRLHLHKLLRLWIRISRRLCMCSRSDRMRLCRSGRCLPYKLSRRRRFLRARSFHRAGMSRRRRVGCLRRLNLRFRGFPRRRRVRHRLHRLRSRVEPDSSHSRRIRRHRTWLRRSQMGRRRSLWGRIRAVHEAVL
jgi:hypothetical protein